MDAPFWIARWREGRIGFHEGVPNAFLAKHVERFAASKRILVPLCGKTEDLVFLAAQGADVIGVELVEDAVRQFFVEHALTPAIATRGAFQEYRAGTITVLVGDIFATTRELVGPIDAIYDRAALIALPPPGRDRYAKHLREIAAGARHELLLTVDYPPGSMDGPPFAVPDTEVHARFADATIERLGTSADPRGRADGHLLEHCYAIQW